MIEILETGSENLRLTAHHTRRNNWPEVDSNRDNNKYKKHSIASKLLVLKTCRNKLFTVEQDRTADFQRSYIQTLNSDVNKQKSSNTSSSRVRATQALDGDQWWVSSSDRIYQQQPIDMGQQPSKFGLYL